MIRKAKALGFMLVWPVIAAEWFPVLIQEPNYPILANQARIQGTVTLKLILDHRGVVSAAEVLSGHPILARAARDNIMSWKFSMPCGPSGATQSSIQFVYVFRLQGVTMSEPKTDFRYEHPYKVVLTSEAQHWMPYKVGP